MADNTPFHNFNRFDKLESWDYNPDFEKLDARLELRGSAADRPSSAPDGAKYVVDDPNDADHGATYIYDTGTSTWNKQPVDTPAVDAEQLNNEYQARTVSELRNAIGTHESIRVAPGTYTISTPIDIDATTTTDIDLRGVIIQQADGAGSDILTTGSGGDITVYGGTLDGNSANNTAGTGLYCGADFDDATFINTKIRNIPDLPIHIDGAYDLTFISPDVDTYYGNAAVEFTSNNGPPSHINFTGGQVISGDSHTTTNGTYGFNIANGATNVYVSTKAQNFASHAYRIDGAVGVTIKPAAEFSDRGVSVTSDSGVTSAVTINSGSFNQCDYGVYVNETTNEVRNVFVAPQRGNNIGTQRVEIAAARDSVALGRGTNISTGYVGSNTVDFNGLAKVSDGILTNRLGGLRVTRSGHGYGTTSFENLSGKTGNFDGETRLDDGTNTAARGTPCVWDGTNSVWRPSNNPSSGSFT